MIEHGYCGWDEGMSARYGRARRRRRTVVEHLKSAAFGEERKARGQYRNVDWIVLGQGTETKRALPVNAA